MSSELGTKRVGWTRQQKLGRLAVVSISALMAYGLAEGFGMGHIWPVLALFPLVFAAGVYHA